MFSYVLSVALVLGAVASPSDDPREIEKRIITYVKDNLQPGKPLVVSKLYNEVFTSTEERQVLNKLNGAFFRIPLFIVEHQVTQERLPTLEEIAGQFDFYGPEEADVVLSIMESDPRVPKFIKRDPSSGELMEIDVEKVKADPRFNQLVERSISGWEGKSIPLISGTSFEGEEVNLEMHKGRALMLYVWFTNCPPCVRTTPQMVTLQNKYGERGFAVLGANADKVLGLPYDDAVRADYVAKQSISYTNVHLTKEAREALGNINIFPTLFLVDSEGTIVEYYVNYQPLEDLERAVEKLLN